MEDKDLDVQFSEGGRTTGAVEIRSKCLKSKQLAKKTNSDWMSLETGGYLTQLIRDKDAYEA